MDSSPRVRRNETLFCIIFFNLVSSEKFLSENAEKSSGGDQFTGTFEKQLLTYFSMVSSGSLAYKIPNLWNISSVYKKKILQN